MPLVGSIPGLLTGRYAFLERARDSCGGIFELDLGLSSVTVICDPYLAEEVLIQRPQHFDKGEAFWEGGREWFGNGLILSEGEHWRRQRRLMNPGFRRERIASFEATIAATIEEQIHLLEGPATRGQAIDFCSWSSPLIATLAARLLLGSEPDQQVFAAFSEAVSVLFSELLSGMVTRKLPRWIPVPGIARAEAARATIDAIVLELIAERRANPASGGTDLLSMLISATDERGAMSDEDLRDEIVVIYIAGYETTAAALAWMMRLLADVPELVGELQAALDRGEDPGELALLDACVRESLRLYPPALVLPRRAAVDEELGGYRIAAGSSVAVVPWLIQRNPEFWPEPTRFDPSRHLDGPARPRLAWMPFGAGQRTCIGKGLAMMELRAALASVLRRYTPRPAPDCPPAEPRMTPTLSPRNGVWLRLEPRA